MSDSTRSRFPAAAAPRRAAVRRDPGAKDRQFVAALARGLQVLHCYRGDERYLGNQEFAARTGLPKPTISRLTHTLTCLGYLEYAPALAKYSLGAAVLSLSYPYLAALDVRQVAQPLMQELADYAQATVSLGASDGDEHMVFLEICQGSQMFRMHMAVGQRVPHGTSAMGRAYIAAHPPGLRSKLIERSRSLTAKKDWPAVRTSIEQALADCDKHGFCYSFGDWDKDVWAVGTPMVSRDSAHVLAFNISGPVFSMNRERLQKDIGPRLMALRDRVVAATGGNF